MGRPEDGDGRRFSGKVEKFEDLEVWKEGMRLAQNLYQTLRDCRDYGLRDQMQRSAVSIPSNIAEGYERNTNKDFIHFLYIAKGSCSELRTQIYLAIEIGFFDKTIGDKLLESTRKISAMLYNLIKVRRERF
ncbi:MAG: four helix bundle protein [Planctomycetia bacterium]|nr:four helix bundle protein [Planctomycetia bacterium]